MASSLAITGGPSFDWITLKGEGELLGMALEDVSRPGVKGHAYREDAKRAEPFWMTGSADYASLALANLAYADLKASVGKPATVLDDYGVTWLNLMLLRVDCIRKIPVRNAVGGLLGGAGQALLVARMLFQVCK